MPAFLGYLFTTCSDSVMVTQDSPLQIFGMTDDIVESHLTGIEEIKQEFHLRKREIEETERQINDLKQKIYADWNDIRNHDEDSKQLLALVKVQGRHMRQIEALKSNNKVCEKVSKHTKRHVSILNANIVTQWVYKSDIKTVIWVPIQEQTYSFSIEEDAYLSHDVILPVVDLKPSLVRAIFHQKPDVYQSEMKNNSGCISDDTHLYVCDDRNHRVVAYHIETTEVLWVSGSYGDLDGQFQFLGGISADANHLYVCDWRGGRIEILVKSTGEFVRNINPVVTCHEGAKDVAYDGGLLFILFSFISRIQVREVKSGNIILEWGMPGSGPGEFRNPLGISVDTSRVYVSDTHNNRIQVFDRNNGKFLFMWGKNGSLEGELKSPKGISVWGGWVLVADCENNRVQCFSTEGEFVCILSLWTQLYQPYMVYIDSKNIFISDAGNSRVVKLDNICGDQMRKLQDSTAEPKDCGTMNVHSLDY